MKKKIWRYLVILLSCYLVVFSFPKTIFAVGDPDGGGGGDSRSPGEWEQLLPGRCVKEGDVATIQGFECIFINIVRILLPLLVIALFLMLVLGSFEWLTSAGDPKKLQKARATLTYAILGLVIFFSIYFIFNLIKTIINVDVNKFVVPPEP